MLIREYEPGDLEGCRQLWRALTQRHRDIYDDPTIGGDDPGPYFDEQYLTHPHFAKAWVAEDGSELVGLCGLLVDGDEAEVEPIVVRPERRGAGIGSMLAQQAIAEASALGKRFINVRPVGRNVEAIAFFHREGFQLIGRLELSIPLGDNAGPKRTQEIDLHGRTFSV